jgi:hypothetical protein
MASRSPCPASTPPTSTGVKPRYLAGSTDALTRGQLDVDQATANTHHCVPSKISRRLGMNGWLMWGLVLPVLLVVAGVVARRRRNRQH